MLEDEFMGGEGGLELVVEMDVESAPRNAGDVAEGVAAVYTPKDFAINGIIGEIAKCVEKAWEKAPSVAEN